jgi:putative endonuclease
LSKNKEIGRKGESIAVDYLIRKGYTIVEKNYAYRRFEIDIIAKQKNTIVFVEVKTRQTTNFGYPEESVDNEKIQHILKCADHFIYQNQWTGNIRFDIISIMFKPRISVEHIEDAFY